ncbi:MAG: hypothetical protein O3A94_16500 [Proteobacteria bacterium]|nr:hypothetical protein [Pseudomonadota bacterium]
MVICFDDAIVHFVAEAQGVADPREFYIGTDLPMSAMPGLYPSIIKPNTADECNFLAIL